METLVTDFIVIEAQEVKGILLKERPFSEVIKTVTACLPTVRENVGFHLLLKMYIHYIVQTVLAQLQRNMYARAGTNVQIHALKLL